MNYDELKRNIADVVKPNGNQEITGQIMQDALFALIENLGEGWQFGGAVRPSDVPALGADVRAFYLAVEKGVYADFGGIEVTEDEVVILYYDTEWHKVATGIASQEKLTELGQEVKDTYGDYVENTEWVQVVTDSQDKILYGVKTDGKFYFGDGCPPQIREYVTEHLAEITAELNNKVDKVTGKSLIDAEFATSQEVVTSPEYLQVTTDSEDKILEGIKTDGTKVIELPLEIQGVRQETINNPEFIQVTTDSEGRIIEATRKDGKKVFYGGIEGLEEEIKRNVNEIVPIEYIREDSTHQYLVVGRDNEGAKQNHCVAVGIDILTNNTGIKNMVVGCDSMHDCTGHDNTAMGYHSSYRNTSGNYNASFGAESQDDNTEGTENTSVGYCSMQRNNLGSLNTAIGAYALQGKGIDHYEPENLKTFTRNVAVGANAMFDAATGSRYNVALGYCALGSRKEYKYNIAIGEYVDCDKDGQTIIGSSHTVETMVMGDFIVKGTDGIKRRVIFNNDGTCSWELVED